MAVRVELLYDPDCPNVGMARVHLLRAFALAGLVPRWREWRRGDRRAPKRILAYGSPTILVDGQDVVPLANDASCCRLYAQPDGSTTGIPSVEVIRAALAGDKGRRSGWKSAGIWLPAVAVASLPKLICPACWPAYAALAGAFGMPFLLETPFLLPITLAALGLVLTSLTWGARERRGYGPALLGLAAGVAIISAKFLFLNWPITYAGAGLLFVACIWNRWPQRKACPACKAPGEALIHKTSINQRSSNDCQT